MKEFGMKDARAQRLAKKVIAMIGAELIDRQIDLDHIPPVIISAVVGLSMFVEKGSGGDRAGPNGWIQMISEVLASTKDQLEIASAEDYEEMRDEVFQMGFCHLGYSPVEAMEATKNAHEKVRQAKEMLATRLGSALEKLNKDGVAQMSADEIAGILRTFGFGDIHGDKGDGEAGEGDTGGGGGVSSVQGAPQDREAPLGRGAPDHHKALEAGAETVEANPEGDGRVP